jgi:hypothetical protein
MSQELLKGTVYWREIRSSLFVHNEKWDETVKRLPELLNSGIVYKSLQTVDQLLASGLHGVGTIGNKKIEVTPDKYILLDTAPLFEGVYTTENLFLQWMYQFCIIETLASHLNATPLPEWNPTFITLFEDKLHVMTYIAALILLYEEGQFKAVVTDDNFQSTKIHVRNKVQELTSTIYSKCAEYGESFRRHGVQGTLPRLWDKIARYAQLSALGRDAKYEPKLDSARDLLGYCIIAWSLIHELDEDNT